MEARGPNTIFQPLYLQEAGFLNLDSVQPGPCDSCKVSVWFPICFVAMAWKVSTIREASWLKVGEGSWGGDSGSRPEFAINSDLIVLLCLVLQVGNL